MNNACNKIDISDVNSLSRIKSDISLMTLEELRETKKEYSEIISFINKRINEVKPKTRQRETLTYDVKESQASDPIQSREDAEKLIKYFLDRDKFMVAAVCIFGFNNGNRISDIINIKVNQLVYENGIMKGMPIQEHKNHYKRFLYFNDTVRNALEYLIKSQNKTQNDYLFTSSGYNKQYEMICKDGEIIKVQKPITYEAVRSEIKKACSELGFVGNFATHTLRKSCLNFVAQSNKDLFQNRMLGDMAACAFAGHSSLAITEKFYLSLTEQERKTVHERLNIGAKVLSEYLLCHK